MGTGRVESISQCKSIMTWNMAKCAFATRHIRVACSGFPTFYVIAATGSEIGVAMDDRVGEICHVIALESASTVCA